MKVDYCHLTEGLPSTAFPTVLLKALQYPVLKVKKDKQKQTCVPLPDMEPVSHPLATLFCAVAVDPSKLNAAF